MRIGKKGPLFATMFAHRSAGVVKVKDAAGQMRQIHGLYGALSFDEGKTWPILRPITRDEPKYRIRTYDGKPFTMSPTTGERWGYMASCQTPDGVVHLLSSYQHYAFNLAWLKTPIPR